MRQESKESQFIKTDLSSIITECALALVGIKDNDWTPLGSCVVIGGNFGITAKHVIQYYFNKHEHIQKLKGNISGKGKIIARQFLNKGKKGLIWNVSKIWLSPITDVAFIYFSPTNQEAVNHRWKSCKIDVLPPPVESRIVGFGYHSSRITTKKNESILNVRWYDTPSTTVGEVKEIYPDKRDIGMLNFPCYRTNARFEAGMSGGPVFNDLGHLCGLVCASYKGAQKGGSYTSYVVSIWPSFSTFVDVHIPEYKKGSRFRVYELARLKRISTSNFKYLKIKNSKSKDAQIILESKNRH